jgi:hypothetical protein
MIRKRNLQKDLIFNEFHLKEVRAFRRLNRAKIEKRARPPLRPAPIVKPLTEAMKILRSFSESFNGIESNTGE